MVVTLAFLAQHLVRMLMQSSMSISARAPAQAFGATPRQIWAHSCEHERSASSGLSERQGHRSCMLVSGARLREAHVQLKEYCKYQAVAPWSAAQLLPVASIRRGLCSLYQTCRLLAQLDGETMTIQVQLQVGSAHRGRR